MKTPREILLERHRSALPALDAVRRAALNPARVGQPLAPPRTKKYPPMRLRTTIWREIFAPCQPLWGALAGVWVVIVWLSLPSAEAPPVIASAPPVPVTGDTLIALKEQRRFFAQLLDLSPVSLITPAWNPGPRGEIPNGWAIA